jgi:hypothetical protein
MKPQIVFVGVLLWALTGCHRGEAPEMAGIESYGLAESPGDHPLLKEAIDTANLVLGTDPAKFAPGWKSDGAATIVRVFAATPKGLGKSEVMTSFPQCHCVVVQVGRIQDWLKQETGSSSALLSIDMRNLLAYMLLHEMGHITHGDVVGAEDAAQSTATGTSKFNLDSTAQKAREVAADGFAAHAIGDGEREKGSDRGLAATELGTTLAELSWNLGAHRSLDNFGATALHEPAVFYDAGLSHPNLEWRILSVNAEISGSPSALELLHQFEEGRKPRSYVLFQAKP